MIRKYLTLLLVTLFAATALTSCLSEGDETIALENGQPKELIKRGNWRIKEWKGNPPEGLGWKIDDVFKFEDDGTLRKWPKDGKKHRWHWIVDPDNGGGSGSSKTPKGINIDDEYEFGWDSWGRGHWVIYYPRTNPDHPSWVIDFGGEDDNEEYFGEPDEPEEEEPEVEEPRNIVREICQKAYDNCWSYDFTYDKEWRITKLVYRQFYQGKQSVSTYNYDYIGSVICVTDENDKCIYEYSLNEKGLILADYRPDGYLYYFDAFKTKECNDMSWSFTTNDYHINASYTSDCKTLNNSNIDLNCFINGYDFVMPQWFQVLAAFGFLGPKMPFLVNTSICQYFDYYFKYTNIRKDDFDRVTSLVRVKMSSFDDEVIREDEIFISYYK